VEIGAVVLLFVVAPVVCLGIPAGLITWAILHSRRVRQRRIAYCLGWAAHHGFHYVPSDPSMLAISRQPPFTTGSGREALDVFRGTFKGVHLHCFQYRYRTSDGENTTTHDYQVVAISLPAMRPLLDIAHENSLTRRFSKDLEFENQAFNDRFKVASPSPRFAHDVIHPRTMEWMLADPRTRLLRWRFEGAWLMTFRPGPIKPDEVFYYADFLHQVLAQVPKHVWTEP
jgi:hypothetical protein